ncbi:MAG TPA: hypothetical protein VFJ15_11325 [Oleiagrimonas sp.]|nr:hypothetical protein [Oleiagrimonas sp.]
MKHSPADTFETRARDLYRRAGPRVDPATAGQLRAIRRDAMEARHRHGMRWMVPTGAVAAALLAAVVVWQPTQRPGPAAPPNPAPTKAATTDVLPPDVGSTDPSLYQNLGFYAWLAQQPARAHTTSEH